MRKSINTEIKTYFPLLGRIGLIILIPLFMYLWGTAIIYNLANFWNIAAPSKTNNLPAESELPVLPPVLSTLPAAIKQDLLSVSGFAQEGLEVALYVNNLLVAKARSGKNGEFSFQNVKLLEGENQIFAKATSSQKTESLPSQQQTVIYLKKAPVLQITNLPSQTDLHQKENLFTIKGLTDPRASISINGSQAFVDSSGNFSFSYPLADGENIVTVEAVDKAGNKSTLERTINFFQE